ncbi:MAG TPA: hypothetical protein VNG13_07440 [Mycobacteriales bacterium]|nr:hypothetical protein [Mycobacteriales bacterium]
MALRFCWAVLGAPTGKRLVAVMGERVGALRRFGELEISDPVAALPSLGLTGGRGRLAGTRLGRRPPQRVAE